MAVSLRVTGAWAELTNDGAVAIPATPQAGDRMYLFARWKDFSVTAQVTSPVTWTEIAEFTDGAVTAGNGTGSVKVACWYRDWQSGDTNPTIDFSATVENASVVIMVMQKAADDVWLTPVAVTAAMTNWTTTSQIVAASATAVVPGGGVVMGLIGIRDDSATMTRPTSGIDDSTGAITWNGDYVESPATHHTTTTGFDGATDLGYRLVTTGATATLRMTGTISAAETGAALWVVQGVSTVVIPPIVTLTVATFAPTLKISIVPASATLVVTALAPALKSVVIPTSASLSITSFQPAIVSGVIPAVASLSISSFAPTLLESVTPTTASLTLTTFAPSPATVVIPGTASLTITANAPSLASVVIPAALTLSIATFVPSVLPFNLVFLDPGGDAVQAVGRFNTEPAASTGDVTFDSTQQVVGVGSYKFDSTTDNPAFVHVAGVLGASRRVSAYFRYDSVPDASFTVTEFVGTRTVYSGGGFASSHLLSADDGTYATATPAQNAGQGSVFSSFGLEIPVAEFPPDAVIESVKIIYDRKYSTDTSIGISRVKWRVSGVEGPNHDNTDQPLTDTVVTVDVTADREWARDDLLGGAFEVIAEARRGDTATSHTQSWDYIKVEVQYHPATAILRVMGPSVIAFAISVTPKGSGVVLWFADGDLNGYQGITELAVNTWHRISFSYVHHAVDDLDINIYVNGIQELSIVGAATNNTDFTKFEYGWVISPGVDHLCWFDQLYIDDGDDLSDPGNVLMTAKLPASVSDNEWNVTAGTGAVDERPLSETNHRKETREGNFRQTYTLQTAAVGDVDMSTETLVGYMGWVWAKMQSAGENCFLVVNGNDVSTLALLTTSSLIKHPVTLSAYPSNAAGIGMLTDEDTGGVDVFLYECGVIVAYEGPVEDQILPFQLLAQDSLTDLTDDLRAAPPSSYELCYRSSDSATALATVTVSSLDQETGSIQQQAVIPCNGGIGRVRITPGIEVQISIAVTGGDISLGLWHRLNVD